MIDRTSEAFFEDEQMVPPPVLLLDLPPEEFVEDMPLSEIIEALQEGVSLGLETKHGCYQIEFREQFIFEVWDHPESSRPSYHQLYPDFDALLAAEASRPDFVLSRFQLV